MTTPNLNPDPTDFLALAERYDADFNPALPRIVIERSSGVIDKGRLFLRVYPHLAIFPCIALALTVLAFNFLGDGLRDALDPRLTKD